MFKIKTFEAINTLITFEYSYTRIIIIGLCTYRVPCSCACMQWTTTTDYISSPKQRSKGTISCFRYFLLMKIVIIFDSTKPSTKTTYNHWPFFAALVNKNKYFVNNFFFLNCIQLLRKIWNYRDNVTIVTYIIDV